MPQESVKTYSISLGCPKNRVDTERMLGATPRGTTPVQFVEDAELILINTCSFIAPAIEESVRTIVETVDDISDAAQRPKLVVAGCLPARFGAELGAEIPEVDLWLTPDEMEFWPERIAALLEMPETLDGAPTFRVLSTPPSYAYLKIGEGCNHACRYCTIPSIRGPLRSADADTLVREARSILAQGVSELTVVAQDVTSYGRDQGRLQGLPPLLEKLLPLDGLKWLRLLYLYPSGINEELLSFLKQAGAPFIPYFDIPFQHAHPAVLKAMGRPKSETPERVVEKVRAAFPEAAIRTSLIVGYPGETPEQYEALLRFVAETRMHHVGVFPFHAEEGTPAAAAADQIPEEEKLARRDEIMALQAEISAELLEECIGEEMDVLVDAEHDEWPGLHVGRTWFQAPEADGATYISGKGVRPGAMVSAEITEAQEYDLVALAEPDELLEE